jgi:uncharacterized protein
MPVQPSYPGVYIEEIPSGVRTISGVSTSIALFMGRTAQGPLNTPKRCLSFAEFERTFSGDTTYSELARSVKLFFDNGGTECFVVRIANYPAVVDAGKAKVTLSSEAGAPVLVLTAKSPGVLGNQIRAEVSYESQQPECTFNMTIYRMVPDAGGQMQKKDVEPFVNLSMDATSGRFAPLVLTQGSRLVDAKAQGATSPSGQGTLAPSATGLSESGRPLSGAHPATWNAAIGTGTKFMMSVDGSGFVPIDISGTAAGVDLNALGTNLTTKINPQLPAGKTVTVTFVDIVGTGGGAIKGMRIASANGDVFIQASPDSAKDLARRLMLGTDNGGVEVSRWAAARPAPTGSVLKRGSVAGFADLDQVDINQLTIDGTQINFSLVTAGTSMWQDGLGSASVTGNSDGVREKMNRMAAAVNAYAASNPGFAWRAKVWGQRMAILPANGADNATAAVLSAGDGYLTTTGGGATVTMNVARYSLGTTGAGSFQTAGVSGADGGTPILADYTAAFEVVRKEVDLFNLMVLPRDFDAAAIDRQILWGPASVFCQQKRAFLLIDPPESWVDREAAASGMNPLRAGAVKTHSAVFFPKVRMIEGTLTVDVSPAGAIAGVMARTDATRGVWKAPAGMDADIRAIVGLTQKLSDEENGVLNPRGVNTLRSFPSGIVNWGARTLDGDDNFGSEWKYIPVRRIALYIEESLYRGTQWVVFEPNDEPLWAQIRLNVGAFMHSLFRQGAFQGKTPREAYFVRCDKDTTTQDDINRGIVNIVVGFAPLKPAEFVIIKLQQIAGQLAT